jgi:hypothetical protein
MKKIQIKNPGSGINIKIPDPGYGIREAHTLMRNSSVPEMVKRSTGKSFANSFPTTCVRIRVCDACKYTWFLK